MTKSREAFRTISEVSDWLETPAHVLRFWESKFTQLRPVKRAGGRRYYRPEDMALLGGIKVLLHEQGMTIKGVQKVLRERGARHVAGLGPQPLSGGSEWIEVDPEDGDPTAADPDAPDTEMPDAEVPEAGDHVAGAAGDPVPDAAGPRRPGPAPLPPRVAVDRGDGRAALHSPVRPPTAQPHGPPARSGLLGPILAANPAHLARHRARLRPLVDRLAVISARIGAE